VTQLRIGIDVGGTNTDIVAVTADGQVAVWHKTATTPDVFSGIRSALAYVLDQVSVSQIDQVMLGTTHPVNAIIGRKGLARVGVLRIAAPATLSVPPLTVWPADLADLVRGPVEVIEGGHEFDGTEINPLDEDAVRKFALQCESGVNAIAIVGVTSPANPDHEVRAAAIVAEVLGSDFPVTLGHEVGGLGLIERENSAVLNGALTFVGHAVVDGLERAMAEHGVSADLYLTQNDGTLLSAREAMRRPILTIGSGPTNSMRGAAYLSGLSDTIVVDVGGTSTDVGLLVNGFPRESALAVEIGGIRTNYRMPDLISIGLGGGTIVRTEPALQIGPDSVGHRLTTESLVFGGSTLTLSDISVAGGRADFGTAEGAQLPDPDLVSRSLRWVDERVAVLADRIKAARLELPLVAVGGGAHLLPPRIDGVTEVLRHEHGAVANAIGAAIAEASGVVDRTFRFSDSSREQCLEEARTLATEEAIKAGADPSQVRITTINEIPMAYMIGDCVRVQVKAVGPLLRRP
jgi:N-methylhydantoinase A/oxoprolinase/acetone carboxylase beta subunit